MFLSLCLSIFQGLSLGHTHIYECVCVCVKPQQIFVADTLMHVHSWVNCGQNNAKTKITLTSSQFFWCIYQNSIKIILK